MTSLAGGCRASRLPFGAGAALTPSGWQPGRSDTAHWSRSALPGPGDSHIGPQVRFPRPGNRTLVRMSASAAQAEAVNRVRLGTARQFAGDVDAAEADLRAAIGVHPDYDDFALQHLGKLLVE